MYKCFYKIIFARKLVQKQGIKRIKRLSAKCLTRATAVLVRKQNAD